MIKYFSQIEEFDPKTNQIKVRDDEGNTYVAPLGFFGSVRHISKYTPVIIIADENYKTSDFPVDRKIKINAVAIPIYNESRFKEDEIGKLKLLGSVENGKIQEYIEVGDEIILKNRAEQLKVGKRKTNINNLKLDNPDVSYGDFCEPQNFILRFRPDFPYLLSEFMPTATIFRKAGKIAQAFIRLTRREK